MFKGSIVALITPFASNGEINYPKFSHLIDYHIQNKTVAVLILGTTGESPTITECEREEIIRFCVSHANKRIPIIVGTGSNSTSIAIEKSIQAQNLGADALLLVAPYYNKGNLTGIIKHYETIASSVILPCILYNVPGRTGAFIPVKAVEVLSKHVNIIGIKEASGDLGYSMKIAKFLSHTFSMWSGNDDMVVPLLSIGAIGVISVSANIIPVQTQEMVEAFFKGEIEKSREIQLHYLELINALFSEVNPVPIKEIMNIMGMNVGGYRLPLDQPSDDTKANLATLAKSFNLI